MRMYAKWHVTHIHNIYYKILRLLCPYLADREAEIIIVRIRDRVNALS